MRDMTVSSTKVKRIKLSWTSTLMKGGPLGLSATGRPQNWR